MVAQILGFEFPFFPSMQFPIQHRLRLGRPEPSRSSFRTSVCRSISALRSGIRLGLVEPLESGERRDDTELESLALISDGILLLVEPAVETEGTITVRGSEFISLLRRSHASQSAKSAIRSALMALLFLCNFKDRQQSTTVMPIMVWKVDLPFLWPNSFDNLPNPCTTHLVLGYNLRNFLSSKHESNKRYGEDKNGPKQALNVPIRAHPTRRH